MASLFADASDMNSSLALSDGADSFYGSNHYVRVRSNVYAVCRNYSDRACMVISTDGLPMDSVGARWQLLYPIADGLSVAGLTNIQAEARSATDYGGLSLFLADNGTYDIRCTGKNTWTFSDSGNPGFNLAVSQTAESVMQGILTRADWQISGGGTFVFGYACTDSVFAAIDFDFEEPFAAVKWDEWEQGKVKLHVSPADGPTAEAFDVAATLDGDMQHYRIDYRGAANLYENGGWTEIE